MAILADDNLGAFSGYHVAMMTIMTSIRTPMESKSEFFFGQGDSPESLLKLIGVVCSKIEARQVLG